VLGSNDILELIIGSFNNLDNFYHTQEIDSLRSSPTVDQPRLQCYNSQSVCKLHLCYTSLSEYKRWETQACRLLDGPAHLGSDTADRDEVIGRSAHSVHLLHHARQFTVTPFTPSPVTRSIRAELTVIGGCRRRALTVGIPESRIQESEQRGIKVKST